MIIVDNLLERYLLLCNFFHTNWDVATFAYTSKDRLYSIIDILDRSPHSKHCDSYTFCKMLPQPNENHINKI